MAGSARSPFGQGFASCPDLNPSEQALEFIADDELVEFSPKLERNLPGSLGGGRSARQAVAIKDYIMAAAGWPTAPIDSFRALSEDFSGLDQRAQSTRREPPTDCEAAVL